MATYLKLKDNIKLIMQNKGFWQDSLEVEIPKKWEKYGNTVLIDKDRYLKNLIWKQAGSELWTIICESLNAERIVLKGRINPDGYRTPNCEVVWGDSPWIECLDNGIKYTWNVTKSMFCSGNASERHRIATMDCMDEVIVDLYAGIGYFTLPYLVHAKAHLVYACEWNPHAVEALEKNLLMNNVADKCVVHPGDNQLAGLNDIADRVNCGLLPSSRSGWELACKVLKTAVGGVLHLHENVLSGNSHNKVKDLMPKCERKCFLTNDACKNTVNEGDSFGKVSSVDCVGNESCKKTNENVVQCKKEEWRIWCLEVSCEIQKILKRVKGGNWETKILKLNHVKSYAPRVDHLVLDLLCKPIIT